MLKMFDVKKLKGELFDQTGIKLSEVDPLFAQLWLNKKIIEEYIKIVKHELETDVLKDLPDLIIGLNLATDAAKNIRNLNGDAKNVQALIIKYKSAEDLIDKKIDEINKAASLFNKPFFFTFSGAIVIGILSGLTIGHFAYKESLQAMEVDREFKDLSEKRLEFEQQHEKMMLADREGVIFYSDGISLPTNAPDTTTVEGHALYRYPKSNRSPLPKK